MDRANFQRVEAAQMNQHRLDGLQISWPKRRGLRGSHVVKSLNQLKQALQETEAAKQQSITEQHNGRLPDHA
jgi:DNA primase